MKFLTLIAAAVLSTSAIADTNNTSDSTSGSQSNQGQGQSLQDNSVSTNNGSDLSRMVPGAFAPALTTTLSETCHGSTSGGVGFSGFSISLGSTWRDSACIRRLDARQVAALHPNFVLAAKEIMCDSQQVRDAFLRAGMPCADDVKK